MAELLTDESDWGRFVDKLYITTDGYAEFHGGEPYQYPCCALHNSFYCKKGVHIFLSFFYINDAMDLISEKIHS